MLIDVGSGKITSLNWKAGTTNVLESVPVRDSVMAIAGEDYFDWPVLPEAPSSLAASVTGDSVKLSWEVHGGGPTGVAVERRSGSSHSKWDRIATLPAAATAYSDSATGQELAYRVRALNAAGESAYSNIVRVSR